MNQNKHRMQSAMLLSAVAGAVINFNVLASDEIIGVPHPAQAFVKQKKAPEQYVMYEKTLTLEQYKKGLSRLNNYLTQRLKDAPASEKRFFVKEKAALDKEMEDIEGSLNGYYGLIDKRIQRIETLTNVFTPSFIHDIGYKLRQLDNQLEAVKAFREIARSNSQADTARAEAEYQLGLVAQDNLNFKQTLQHFKNAVKLQNKNTVYLEALADLHLTLEDFPQASEHFKSLQKILKKQGADVTRLAEIAGKLRVSSAPLKNLTGRHGHSH